MEIKRTIDEISGRPSPLDGGAPAAAGATRRADRATRRENTERLNAREAEELRVAMAQSSEEHARSSRRRRRRRERRAALQRRCLAL